MKRTLLSTAVLLAVAGLGVLGWLRLGIEADPSMAPQGAPTDPPGAVVTAPSVAAPSAVRSEVDQRQPLVDDTAATAAPQGVTGQLVDEVGRAIAGADVFLLDSPSNDRIGRFLGQADQVPLLPLAKGQSDAEGRFRLGIPQARDAALEVFAQAAGFASERVGDLHVPAKEWVDVGRITLGPGTTIRGHVYVAGTRLPAPLAQVRLESGDPFMDLGPSQLVDFRDDRSVRTDATGYYELRHAPRRGLFRLIALAPGFTRLVRDRIEIEDTRPLEVDFELLRGLSIRGRLDTGGRPLQTARIEAISRVPEPVFAGELTGDGRFDIQGLREGDHVVKVWAQGFRPVQLDGIKAGDDSLVIPLAPCGSASISVRDPDGMPLREYRLAVRRYFEESGGQIGVVRDIPERSVRLDARQTEARVEGLDLGTFVFQVTADGFASTLSAPFAISDSQVHAAVALTMDRGGTLLGRVIDEAGSPIAGASVRTQADGAAEDNPVWKLLAGHTPQRFTRKETTTATDGAFALPLLAHADYQMEISHPDFCRTIRRRVRVDADGEQWLDPIALLRGTIVTGRIVVEDTPAGQVKVVLTPARAVAPDAGQPARPAPVPSEKMADETQVDRVEVVANRDGSFTLPRRVPPGIYEVQAAPLLGNDPGSDVIGMITRMRASAQQVTVLTGQERVEVVLRLERRNENRDPANRDTGNRDTGNRGTGNRGTAK